MTFETVIDPRFDPFANSKAWSMIVNVPPAVGVPTKVGMAPL